jgi:hypothetical protein
MQKLIVAEYVAKSMGKFHLDRDDWKFASQLEKQRNERDYL